MYQKLIVDVNGLRLLHSAAMKKPGNTKDFLLRDMPLELSAKLKVAASLHQEPMKSYIIKILERHVQDLEKKGVSLSLKTRM